MFKISAISYTHIGATYEPFQHIQRFNLSRPPPNKQSKHPTPPTLALRLFLQPLLSSKGKTRLAGHLVWKALTHAKGKHTEPHQQLSSEKDWKKHSVVVVPFLFLFGAPPKKKPPRNNRSWKIEPEFVSSGRWWFGVFSLFNFTLMVFLHGEFVSFFTPVLPQHFSAGAIQSRHFLQTILDVAFFPPQPCMKAP